jgi:hypothetical protein
MQASEIARLLTRVLVFDNNIMMNISYIEGVHANFFLARYTIPGLDKVQWG